MKPFYQIKYLSLLETLNTLDFKFYIFYNSLGMFKSHSLTPLLFFQHSCHAYLLYSSYTQISSNRLNDTRCFYRIDNTLL